MNTQGTASQFQFLSGGGEMGALTRAKDWASTSVGEITTWPQSLRTTISIILNSKFPMFLWWGNDLIQFYNDAYRPSLGNNGKHPTALGQKGEACWPEIWPVIKPLIDQVLQGGESTWSEDQLIPIYRNGTLEDVYWTFSYSPVKDESGDIKGVLVVCTETTSQISNLKKVEGSEKNFRTMINDAPVSTAIFRGPEFIIELANADALKLWGKDKQVIGKPIIEAIPELKGQAFMKLLHDVYTTGKSYIGKENLAYLQIEGQLKPVYVNFIYKALYNDSGTIDGILTIGYDVTEQVVARNKIKDAEERLRLALDAAMLGTFDVDLVTDTSSNSARLYEVFGFDHAVSRDTLLTAIHPDDVALRTEALRQLMVTGELNYEVRVTWKDKSIHWLQARGRLFNNEQGKPVRILGTVADVTTQRNALTTVADSAKKFRNTVRQAPVAICIFRGPEFIIEMANDKMLELWNKTSDQVINKRVFEGVPEAAGQGFEQILQHVYKRGERFFANEVEISLSRKNGIQKVYVNFVYEPLREEDGTISGITAVAADVTQQVLARFSIQESEKQFRNLITPSPIAMAILRGNDMVVELANHAMLKIWQREGQYVLGRKHVELLPEWADQKYPALMDQVFSSGIPYQENESVALIRKGNEYVKFYLNYRYAPLFENDGKTVSGLMVTINDVTEMVEAREKIRDAADRLTLATEGTQLATWDLNLDTREFIHSSRLAIHFGHSKSKTLTHQQVRGQIHPDDLHLVEEAFALAMKTGTYQYEARTVHPDKMVRWIKTEGKVIFDQVRKPLRMIGTLRDITEDKAAEEKISSLAERLKIVIDASELGTWELDIITNGFSYSPRYSEILGYGGRTDVTYAEFIKHLHPEDLVNREKAFKIAYETGSLHYTSRLIWNDGSIHWVESKGNVFFDQDHKPVKLIGTARDLTEERTYQQRIEESEQRFRNVADTVPVLIWMSGTNTLFYFFNKAWLSFTGRTIEQEFGNGWSDGVHPDDLKPCLDKYLRAFHKHKEFYMEYRLRRYDGEYRWISDHGTPRFTKDGAFEGYIGACMDIQDRIVFEEKLKESESRLRIAALSSELGTWSYHPQTNVLSWDNPSRQLYGVTIETPITVELFLSRVHPEDMDMVLQKIRKALDPDIGDMYDAEYRLVNLPNDKIRWIHAKGKAFFDENRNPYLFSGTVLDITEKHLALEELQDSEKKFRLLADSMPQFIWTGDREGNLNYFNQSVYDYSGLSPEKIKKEGWLQIVHPDEQEENIKRWTESINTGKDFIYEHRFRKHDGQYRWQLSRAIPQLDAHGHVQMWVGTSTDVHDQRLMTDQLERNVALRTQELKQANDELARSNTELASFSYVASHDLQEPLRKIQTFATRLLENEKDKLSETGQDYFRRMQSASLRMQTLINDLLTYSRINTTEKQLQHIDLNTILLEVKNDLRETIEEKKATIDSDNLPGLNVIPFQFRQLLTNLIGNSLKFSKPDLAPRIRISATEIPAKSIKEFEAIPATTYVKFTLSDNGIGFDQKYSALIFQVFQRLHGRNEYAGTGIGLSICKKIIENHHGWITAKGELNKGATFIFYIPK